MSRGWGDWKCYLAVVDRTQGNNFVIVIESLIKWKQKKNCFSKWRFHFSEVLESWFIRKYIPFFCLLNQLLFYLLEKRLYVSIYVSVCVCGWAGLYIPNFPCITYEFWKTLEELWQNKKGFLFEKTNYCRISKMITIIYIYSVCCWKWWTVCFAFL